MSGRKLVGGTLSLVSALILIIVILLTTIELNAFNLDFFRSEYRKLNSTQAIGISEQDLLRTTEVLLAYIRGQRHDLQIEAEIKGKMRPVFNTREKSTICRCSETLYCRTLAEKQRVGPVNHSSGRPAPADRPGIPAILGGRFSGRNRRFYLFPCGRGFSNFTGFLWFWNKFHTLIFTNDLWLLNPETDILIQIVRNNSFLIWSSGFWCSSPSRSLSWSCRQESSL
jgi:hypothetical protein